MKTEEGYLSTHNTKIKRVGKCTICGKEIEPCLYGSPSYQLLELKKSNWYFCPYEHSWADIEAFAEKTWGIKLIIKGKYGLLIDEPEIAAKKGYQS